MFSENLNYFCKIAICLHTFLNECRALHFAADVLYIPGSVNPKNAFVNSCSFRQIMLIEFYRCKLTLLLLTVSRNYIGRCKKYVKKAEIF